MAVRTAAGATLAAPIVAPMEPLMSLAPTD